MKRLEKVIDFSNKGYNCAQATACGYADLTGLSHEDMFKITEGLGGGIGRMQGTCGALLASFLVASYFNSDGGLENAKTKLDTYAKMKELNYKFVEKVGSTQCLELLRGEVPKHGSCNDKLQAACEIIEEFLTSKQINF